MANKSKNGEALFCVLNFAVFEPDAGKIHTHDS